VADSEALPIGTPVIDAQLMGLGALAVAFLLAVTRMSVRRRPAAAMAGRRGAANVASTAPAVPAPAGTAPTRADSALDDDPTVDDFTLDDSSADAADAASAMADPEPWETNGEV
jgi:hypothetical protein